MSNSILIVEDTAIVAYHLEHLLANNDYNKVEVVATGEDALQLAEIKKFDLILMDVMLQGKLTGIETAEQIKLKEDIPIIFITSLSDHASKEKILQLGADYFIKPFDTVKVLDAVNKSLTHIN